MALNEDPNIIVSFKGKNFKVYAEPTVIETLFSDEIIHPEVSVFNDYSDFAEAGEDENCYTTDLFTLLDCVGKVELRIIGKTISVL